MDRQWRSRALLIGPPPEAIAPRQRLSMLAAGLVASGREVVLFSARPREPLGPQLTELDDTIRTAQPEVVLVTMSPFRRGALLGLAASTVWGRPLVVDYRDPWHANPYYRHGPRAVPGMLADRGLERRLLRTARFAVTASGGLGALVRARGGANVARIYTGVDPYPVPESATAAARAALADLARPVLLYAGTVGGSEQYPVAGTIGAVLDTWPGSVVVAGPGELGADLRSHPRVRALGVVPRDVVRACYRAADAALLVEGSDQVRTAAYHVPAKVFEVLDAGIPVLGWLAADAEARALLGGLGAGLVEPGDVDALRRAALGARGGEPPSAPSMSDSAKELAEMLDRHL